MSGKPTSRIADACSHSGKISSGRSTVIVGGRPVATRGDSHVCCPGHGKGPIVGGSPTVFAEGRPVARVTDPIVCKKGKHAISSGDPTVLTGEDVQPAPRTSPPSTGNWVDCLYRLASGPNGEPGEPIVGALIEVFSADGKTLLGTGTTAKEPVRVNLPPGAGRVRVRYRKDPKTYEPRRQPKPHGMFVLNTPNFMAEVGRKLQELYGTVPPNILKRK